MARSVCAVAAARAVVDEAANNHREPNRSIAWLASRLSLVHLASSCIPCTASSPIHLGIPTCTCISQASAHGIANCSAHRVSLLRRLNPRVLFPRAMSDSRGRWRAGIPPFLWYGRSGLAARAVHVPMAIW